MSLLLDTQALLWFLLDNARLTNKARTSKNNHSFHDVLIVK